MCPPEIPPSSIAELPKPPGSWVYRRVLAPMLALLKAGLSPEKLALTVSLGVAFGLVPTFGITSVVSTATALRLQLNLAAMQLVAHLMSAFQLVLLVPLLRAGAIVLGHGHEVANLTLTSLRRLIAHDGWGAAGHLLWRAQLGALLLWALAAGPLVAVLYYLFRRVFRRVVARQVASGMVRG
ncbi:DUF2062 domain-containing protein [Hymenobacter sp. BT664]|uniref:DUF2062 domain-containing protein n=1 Tax=Hymenobacter montanus TaxID=2771359 RepID=A0A927BDL9_9BACT|nr:DUF2062 domain-containing protein [Hymenobacter montanus]MBD2768890.1 DUF2062 domain-containing protein [Hymenobacter montanus]